MADYPDGYTFVGGYPTPETIQRAYDDADLNRAIQCYRFFYPTVSIMATWQGNLDSSVVPNKVTPRHAARSSPTRTRPPSAPCSSWLTSRTTIPSNFTSVQSLHPLERTVGSRRSPARDGSSTSGFTGPKALRLTAPGSFQTSRSRSSGGPVVPVGPMVPAIGVTSNHWPCWGSWPYPVVKCNPGPTTPRSNREADPMSQEVLPFPPTPSASQAGRTMQESTYDQRVPERHLPDDAPNILVILIDDAGPGLPSTFGGDVTTTALSRVLEEGIGYNRFHTTAMCSPTRASLLTGRNHHRIGNGQIAELANDWDGYAGEIPKSSALAAEVLKDYGYATAAFGKWHNTPALEDVCGGSIPQLADGKRLRVFLRLPRR